MSTTFSDFLREQADKHRAEAIAGKDMVDEWRSSVERLFATLRDWLKESDPHGVIEVEESQHEVTEPGLGRYRIPRLNLRAFGKWIGIIPKARKTVGSAKPPQNSAPKRATGRVDITDELRRYVLYRFHENGRDVWMIDDLENEPQPLDRLGFERALMSYLR
jgi:hypothetical protein